VRVLGIDYGARRLGLALSDATGTLASPWRRLDRPPSDAETLRLLTDIVQQLRREDDGLEVVVLGWPRRLDGTPTHQTAAVETLAPALERQAGVRVVLQDERLSSHAADEQLAARGVRDWRARKQQIDAAAAAVILQDFLDSRPADACGS
jgi:putative holliday junction resolvase